MKATPKVMPPVLLYWPTVSEADVWWYGSRSWTFPPVFCYILFLCHRQQLRGSLTQHCVTWKCVWSKCVSLNSSIQKKNGTHWHSLMLVEHWWRPNSGWEHSEAVRGALQQWWQWQQFTSAGADFYDCGMQLLFISGKSAELLVVTTLF